MFTSFFECKQSGVVCFFFCDFFAPKGVVSSLCKRVMGWYDTGMKNRGVTVLVPDGDPNGVKILGLSGWDGRVFIVPRAKLKDMKLRPEAVQPGVYFLFGEGKETTRPRVYVGESESFYKRLADHDGKKEFWNVAVAFTGGALDRADVKYLEHRAVADAKKVDRYDVDNTISPLKNALSEFKLSAVEHYYENLQFVLALFGFALFQEVPVQASAVERYYVNSIDTSAVGTLLENGQFMVFAGSLARIADTPSFQRMSNAALRKQLVAEGVLKVDSEKSYKFIQNHIFTTPSQAAEVVMGRSADGWLEWKNEQKQSLDTVKRK